MSILSFSDITGFIGFLHILLTISHLFLSECVISKLWSTRWKVLLNLFSITTYFIIIIFNFVQIQLQTFGFWLFFFSFLSLSWTFLPLWWTFLTQLIDPIHRVLGLRPVSDSKDEFKAHDYGTICKLWCGSLSFLFSSFISAKLKSTLSRELGWDLHCTLFHVLCCLLNLYYREFCHFFTWSFISLKLLKV